VNDNAVADGDGDGDEVDISDAIPILRRFCTHDLHPKQLRQIFQLPRSELGEVLNTKYKICSAYAFVFCTVVEQVANFHLTKYGVDARDGPEQMFEEQLRFEKVGPGFCLVIASSDGEVNTEVLDKFLRRMVSLAGPTLLARAAKTSHDDDDGSDNDGTEEDGDKVDDGSNVPSFRSDRRVVRLVIARYWADRLIEKYNEVQSEKRECRHVDR